LESVEYSMCSRRFLWIQKAAYVCVSLILAVSELPVRILTMNKRNIAPVLMVFFSFMAVLPEAAPLVHAQGTPTVSVSPTFNAADTGSSFQVAIALDGVSDLVAYDVGMSYNTAALSASSINCFGPGTLFGTAPSGSVFPVACTIDNFAGQVECSGTLLGGVTIATASGSLCIINFTALGPFSSDLTILNPQIISVCGGSACQVEVSVVNGTFLSPPVLSFIIPNATTAPGERVRHIFKGQTTVDLQAFIMLVPNAAFSGFGGVIFTIVDPSGNQFTVQSNIAFMFPGNSATVTANFDIVGNNGGTTGTYLLFATLLRCPLPTACAQGSTVQGLSFKVKA